MIHLREKMKVGPKGQVVIPKDIRDAEHIYPGTEVIFETTDHGLHLQKTEPEKDPVEVFSQLAKEINFKSKIDSDKSYDEMMEERWKKHRKLT